MPAVQHKLRQRSGVHAAERSECWRPPRQIQKVVERRNVAQVKLDEARIAVTVWGGDAGTVLNDMRQRLMAANELLSVGDTTAAQAQFDQAIIVTQWATVQFLRQVGANYSRLADRRIHAAQYEAARAALIKAKKLKTAGTAVSIDDVVRPRARIPVLRPD